MQLLDVPVADILIAVAVCTVGAVVQGSVGFGLAVVAAPFLLMIHPGFVPGSLMFAATVLTLLLLVRERHAVVGSEVLVSSFGRLVTTVPTAYVVSQIDEKMFSILFGLAVLIVVGMSFAGWKLHFNNTNLLLASGLSGISNTISAIGGPPMALMYQTQRGDHIRATLSAIFAVGSVISMASLAAVGEFSYRDVALGLLLLPGILLGFGISHYTANLVDQHALRPTVLGVAGLSALVILVRAVYTTG